MDLPINGVNKMTYKLSPSSLTLLEECPRCFWLQVVKKIRRPSGAMSSLPNGMDRMLKKHFDKHRDKKELPPELRNHELGVELFHDRKLLDIWRNNRKGIAYHDKKNNIILYGAIDELLQKGSKLIVLDFKTRGFDLKEDTAHQYQDKMNLYALLFRLNGYQIENYAYLLFYMPESILESGEFVFKTELVKMKINLEHAEMLFQKAIKVLNNKIPEANDGCGFCKWTIITNENEN